MPVAGDCSKRDAATMTDCLLPSPLKGNRTPAPVLRERVHSLRQNLEEKEKENEDLKGELSDLCVFTRLEQEIGVHYSSSTKLSLSEVNYLIFERKKKDIGEFLIIF